MHERIRCEVSLQASADVLAAMGDSVAGVDRQLLYAVVASAVKNAIVLYEIKMAWLQERYISTEASP